MATAKRASERRCRTLAQQAKSYEVAGEYEMMQIMHESWINGNFADIEGDYPAHQNKIGDVDFMGLLYDSADIQFEKRGVAVRT